ncbi:hypothetical protein, conserved [Leishmania braziliensis MHOM/BR/75/M2904]|uniref:Uncharacterized protein n=1 Tax=Leishmania braziliensis TaxID=5660 RepID=A4HEI8_LEIBR|nr:hypothetical protein, conserved [Leishmania braziliensis MHOM/BR/75/M2904]CAM39244.1 hypothetical protein, conserved [Leishmania braziliensis MHOM/BR/75/M2904]
MLERATGGLPADHEYVTSSSSATTIRSASSHSDAASSYSNRHHDEEYYAKEDGAAVPAAPPLTEEEEKTYPDEAGYSTEDMNRDAEPEDAVKEVTSRSSILKSSSSFSSSYSSNRQSSLRDHAAEVAREQAKAEARAEAEAEAEAEAGAYVGDGAEDSYADDGFEDNLSQSHHQSSAAAAYLCPQEEDGKAEALLEPEAVYPLETTEEEAHKESYDDDEFEKSFASRDAADDVEGAPAAPLQQQPEYVEEEEAEKPAAADEASDDAKSGSYEEERLDDDELLSPKKASHNTSDADVSLIEKYEEDQAEVSPEDAQCVTATLTATEDVKPSEKDDVEGSAAEVQSQEEYPQTALGQGDGEDEFEDELSTSKSSAAAAYLCPQEEDGKAEALLESEAVYPLETTEEEAHKESYDDDEFEKSFASRDAADDVEGAPAAPLQQQPEYVEEEEAEKPAAADEASDDAKSGSYEEERLDDDELLSPKKASHNTSDADVSLIEKYEEDQAEVSPEDAQCVTATLTATEDVKPSEKDDVEGSAAEVQSQEEYPQTALGQGDGEDEFEDELSTSKSSAAAAYLCPQEEDGKAEALLEPEAVYPLETTEEEAHKESYDDDEFEKSFASRDAADDVEGAPAAPLQQQPEYVEEEEAEKPAAADEASDDAKSGSYEEERLDDDELLSPKKASHNTSDADVSLIEKYEEDQAEVSPEDAQCATATLTATEDVKPSEKDDVEGSAAEVQSQEEYPQTALGQGDGEDEFEDELSSNKSSATTSVAPSPVAALRKADVPKEEVGEELDRELSPTKAPDAERKREESLMSSSALAPAPPSPSSSNSEVVTASTSAVSPAAATSHKNSAAGMETEELGSGANDTYADDFEGM